MVDTELIPKQRIDTDLLSIKLPIFLMDVFASGYVVSSNSHISELHREVAVSMVQSRDSALLPIDSRLPVALSTLHTAVSLMQRVSRQPEGPQ